MGCFSFKCQVCGRGIKSSSHDGEKVTLYLLSKGKILQQMTGEYDSYGRVFIDGTKMPKYEHLRKSVEWKDPFPDKKPTKDEEYFIKKKDNHWIWLRVCNLTFSDDFSDGIAAIHSACNRKKITPTVRSADDPDQGWGSRREKKVPNYNVLTDLKVTKLLKDIREKEYDVKSMERSALLDLYPQEYIQGKKDSLIELKRQLKELS